MSGRERRPDEASGPVVRPSFAFVAMAVLAVLTIGGSLLVTLRQSHVPFPMRANDMRAEIVLADGPGTLRAIARTPEGPWLELGAEDLVDDPDKLPSYADARRFAARQTEIREVLASAEVSMLVERGDEGRQIVSFTTRPRRLGDLPPTFYSGLVTAVIGFLLSGWVWALRQRQRSAIALACTGLGLLLTLPTASIMNTRALALDGTLLLALSRVNHLGASLFGAAMVALFASYPMRLLSRRVLRGVLLVAAGWAALDFFRILPSGVWGIYAPVVLETIAILALIVVQGIRSWRDPRERAAFGWMGLAVAVGIGLFLVLEPLPALLGMESPVAQGYAELPFLIVYGGVALGVLRYRLFDLGTWAFRGLFYTVGVLLLVASDALLVYVLHLGRPASLGLSLLLVGFVYLPLRAVILARATGRRTQADPKLIEDALAVAFEPAAAERSERWTELLARRFDALEVSETAPTFERPRIEEEGLELAVPAVATLGAVRLRYPRRGRGLFREADRALVEQLLMLLAKAQAGREAYDRGVATERKRMAQDLHDDVGARLVSGLYVADEKTRPILQAALADIRFLVGDLAGERIPLVRLLADLRREAGDRCRGAGVALDWPLPPDDDVPIDYESVKALLSGTREAFTNVFRHAKASRAVVRVDVTGDAVALTIEDDGVGFSAAGTERPASQQGHGLGGMKSRMERVGGSCSIESAPGRTRVTLRIPIAVSVAVEGGS